MFLLSQILVMGLYCKVERKFSLKNKLIFLWSSEHIVYLGNTNLQFLMLRHHFPLFGHICPLFNIVVLIMETNLCHLVLYSS